MDSLLANAFGLDASHLAAEERHRLLSRLLSRLAHEVRNPLSSLGIHVQLLEEDLAALSPPVAPKTTGRLAIIRHELSRLDDVVRQFLTLAAPSAVNLERVELSVLLRDVCQLLGPEADARAITLHAAVADRARYVNADPKQLTQAVVNLAINALQAVERSGRVEITADVEPPPAGSLRIQIRDTGPGIDPDKRLAIFEPFFTTKPEGSGLGLWIVQQVAMAHRGRISAGNAPEGGAVFTLHLPVDPENSS
jgi:two-component system, NtrC family, sensor histidine kinase HydH